jgi:bifunctional DNase/RNase
MMVEVTVARLGYDASSNSYVVILQERAGSRLLPIWIGKPEAESIKLQMDGVPRERPLTHDLCKSLIVGLGAILRRVQNTKVQNSTYFAELHLARPDSLVQIDARPSDSIAIALRLGAPIFAQESLLIAVAASEEEEGEEEDDVDEAIAAGSEPAAPTPEELSAEQLKHYLENLRPEDFGKFSL